jgi:hypothetical protein
VTAWFRVGFDVVAQLAFPLEMQALRAFFNSGLIVKFGHELPLKN